MRWIVTGSDGQLGTSLVELLGADPEATLVYAADQPDLDICDDAAVRARLAETPADVVVNAAAFTAVDDCEEARADVAWRVNAEAPGVLAAACRDAGAQLVHVSTDYVFDGAARTPYVETAPVDPKTAYGRGKAEGERRVLAEQPGALVVRTSWVFGPGRNFVGAIVRQARLRERGEAAGPLEVVDDQWGCPTYAADLARGIVGLQRSLRSGDTPAGEGIYHLSNQGAITWWTFARAILDMIGSSDLEILRTRTADQPERPAKRPLYSVLDCGRAAALGVTLRPWREALAAFLDAPAGRALLEEA